MYINTIFIFKGPRKISFFELLKLLDLAIFILWLFFEKYGILIIHSSYFLHKG